MYDYSTLIATASYSWLSLDVREPAARMHSAVIDQLKCPAMRWLQYRGEGTTTTLPAQGDHYGALSLMFS